MLYHPDRRKTDYITIVGPYGQSLMQLDTRSFIEWSVYTQGTYEHASVRILERLVHPGSVVFDIGANIGIFTLPLARAVGQTGTVHAFEPHPRYRQRLLTNLALNNLRNVVVQDVALGPTAGTAVLHAATQAGSGIASLRGDYGQDEEQFDCRLDTLDNYVRRHALSRVDLIKIDTEGGELPILTGATETLETHRPCVYVEMGGGPEPLKAQATAMFDFLTSIGYEVWRNDTLNSPQLVQIHDPRRDGYVPNAQLTNWLAVHLGAVGGSP